MIISFAWTTSALIHGRKTVTRRGWTDDYARRFKPGQIVQAYDRSPRNGGKRVALIRIASVTYELDADAPDADYEAEGFGFIADVAQKRLDELYGQAWADGMEPEDDDRVLRAERRLVDRGAFALADFDAWRLRGGSSWVVRFALIEQDADTSPDAAARDGET